MQHQHPFRFATACPFTSPTELAETARKVEALGYSPLLSGDHPRAEGAAVPAVSLLMVVAATTTLRLGTHVLANDFRNPVMLAQDGALLDGASGGRFEFGLGTG